MAKKGGQQQLQAEINTDDDLDKFIERPGLIIMDIYSEWCGPCLGMVGTLRKIKLEIGGDSLHLAVCKCDTIEKFKRFRNMSEPTWLFVTLGKAVNLLFGSNVPKLIRIVTDELALLSKPERKMYELTEMQPEEVERYKVKKHAEDEALRIELNAAEAKRREYLTFVTDEIMSSLPDFGVTIFGPQVNRDMFKKVMEPAEAHKLQCKDRKVMNITTDDLKIVNFASSNGLDGDVLEQMLEKDLLLCFWKVSEDDNRPLEEVFFRYVQDLTRKQEFINEFGEVDPEIKLPPILAPIQVKVKRSVEKPLTPVPSVHAVVEPTRDPLDLDAEEAQTEGAAEDEMDMEEQEEEDVDMALLLTEPVIEVPVVEEEPSEEILKIVTVPPVWVPDNKRTHAAAIYVFFRSQTVGFLPPDPAPEPPHIIMTFDAYKKRDIMETIAKFPEEVLSYGFFTNDDPESAQLVATSLRDYELKPFNVKDRIVLKVAKRTSHVVLALATNNPLYISPNTVDGKREANKFFPEGYKTEESVSVEDEQVEKGNVKKKKHKGGKKEEDGTKGDSTESPSVQQLVTAEGAPPPPPGTEGAPPPPGTEGAPPPTDAEGAPPPPGAEGAPPPTEGENPPVAEPAAPQQPSGDPAEQPATETVPQPTTESTEPPPEPAPEATTPNPDIQAEELKVEE